MKISHCLFIITMAISYQYTISFAKTESSTQNSKDTVKLQIESFFDNLKSLSAEFVQYSNSDNKKHKGKIWILRNNKSKVRVKYNSGPVQDIYMIGRYMTIVDRKTKKGKTYSILTTPIYALLSGNLKLNKIDFNIFENSDEYISILINYSKSQSIVMTFSKKNKKIDKLIAWSIEDNKTLIQVGFDTSNYFINEKSKIPTNIFK